MTNVDISIKGKTWSETWKKWLSTRVIASSIVFGAIAVATAYAGLIIPLVPPIVTSVDLLIGTAVTVIVGPIGSLIVTLISIPLVSPTPDLGTVAVWLGYIIYSFGYTFAYKFYLKGRRVLMLVTIWVVTLFGECVVKLPLIAWWVVNIYKTSPNMMAFMTLLFPGDVADAAIMAIIESILMLTIPKFMRPLWVFYTTKEPPTTTKEQPT